MLGGSWGATLALVYAQAHPYLVKALVLRGVFTARQREIDWLYGDGARHLYPEAHAAFLRSFCRPKSAPIPSPPITVA